MALSYIEETQVKDHLSYLKGTNDILTLSFQKFAFVSVTGSNDFYLFDNFYSYITGDKLTFVNLTMTNSCR